MAPGAMSQANRRSQFRAESCRFQLQTLETLPSEAHWTVLPAAPPNAGKRGQEGYCVLLGVSSAGPQSPGTCWSRLTRVRRAQSTATAPPEALDNGQNFARLSPPCLGYRLALPSVEGTSFPCRPKVGSSFYSSFAAHRRSWGGQEGVQ